MIEYTIQHTISPNAQHLCIRQAANEMVNPFEWRLGGGTLHTTRGYTVHLSPARHKRPRATPQAADPSPVSCYKRRSRYSTRDVTVASRAATTCLLMDTAVTNLHAHVRRPAKNMLNIISPPDLPNRNMTTTTTDTRPRFAKSILLKKSLFLPTVGYEPPVVHTALPLLEDAKASLYHNSCYRPNIDYARLAQILFTHLSLNTAQVKIILKLTYTLIV